MKVVNINTITEGLLIHNEVQNNGFNNILNVKTEFKYT